MSVIHESLEDCPCVFTSCSRRDVLSAMHSPSEGRKERTSDFKYSDRGRMFRPIQFTVLERNYNFQLLTIQIWFCNGAAQFLCPSWFWRAWHFISVFKNKWCVSKICLGYFLNTKRLLKHKIPSLNVNSTIWQSTIF